MKTIHLNKILAIAQVKTKAFMGKNCIIIPFFAVGFTLLMRFLYNNMDASSPESLNAYVLSMGLVMNIGMTGIYCPCLLLAEEKEKKTLRVLMTSSVNGIEFFLGSILPVFIVTIILNYVLMPVSGFIITGSSLIPFTIVSVMASLISCIIGMILGIFAKNQVSAGTIMTPVMMILIFIPIFSNIIEILADISKFIFTGIIMDLTMNIASKEGNSLNYGSIAIMAAEVILAIFVFLFFYKKNGFEKD
ncbi:ABC transporter permease [uncultured Robinsoniella sp.]|uniref:ABC transporter permease n=1 Tax=uncultured Robinsoniella sp. TaxID=904190 RepID=UPI00374FCB73